MRHERLRFDRSDVSDGERRLLFRGPESMGGESRLPPRERLFQQHVDDLRAKAAIEKEGTSLLYQRFVDRETEREIKEARCRFEQGRTFYKVRNVQDAHFLSHKLRARAAGAVQDPHMDNAVSYAKVDVDADRARRTAEAHARADAYTDAVREEYEAAKRGEMPLWQTRWFLDYNWEGRQGLLKVWAEGGVPVPDPLLAQYGLRPAAAPAAPTFVSAPAPAPAPIRGPSDPIPAIPAVPSIGADPARPAFVPRSPGSAPVARPAQPTRFPDYGAGLPDKVVPWKAGEAPDRPSAFHVYDVYTGGWKLDRDQVKRTNTLAEMEIRSAEFQSTVRAADARFESVLDGLRAKIATTSGAERAAYLNLHNAAVKQRAADAEEVIAQAERLAGDVEKGVADPRSMDALIRYPLDARPAFARHLYLAQNAPARIDGLVARCEAEAKRLDDAYRAEREAQYARTPKLYDDFLQAWLVADGMKELSATERKGSVHKAIAALNALGTHLRAHYLDPDVPAEERDRHAEFAKRRIEEQGLADDRLLVTADALGVAALLRLRTVLAFSLTGSADADASMHRLAMDAAASEKRYLLSTGAVPESKPVRYAAQIERAATEALALGLREATAAAAERGTPDDALKAAGKELAFLQANDPANPRIKELADRSSDKAGVIPDAYDSLHRPLWEATDEALAAAKDPAGIRAALKALRDEGRFILKHRSDMHEAAGVRFETLLLTQADLVLKLAKTELAEAKDGGPAALSAAIVRLVPEVAVLGASEISEDAAFALSERLASEATGMRATVNLLIDDAKTAKDGDPRDRAAKIDQALYAINAETSALEALSLDPKRLANLAAERSLLGNREALRAEGEKKLGVGAATLPEIESFRHVYHLLHGEEAAIRMAYAGDPESQKEKLDALRQRKAAFGKSVDGALAAAVSRLGDGSSIEDVDRAATLLKASVQMKLGVIDNAASVLDLAANLPVPADYSAVKDAHATIESFRARALERRAAERELGKGPAPSEDTTPGGSAAMPTLPPLANVTRVPGGSPTGKAPVRTFEPEPTPVAPEPLKMRRATGEAVADANGETADPGSAERTAEPAPAESVPAVEAAAPERDLSTFDGVDAYVDDALFAIRQDDAFVTDVETKLRAKRPVDLVAATDGIRARIEALRAKRDEMEDMQSALHEANRDPETFRIEQKFFGAFGAAEDRLERALQRCDLLLDTDASVAEAANTFLGRFTKYQVELQADIRAMQAGAESRAGSGIDTAALKKELLGDATPADPGVFAKAIEHRLADDVIRRLQSAKNYLDPPSS